MTITLLDPIGASLSLLATYYFTKADIKAWPVSIGAIMINSILYWQKGIYGQMGLEAIYFSTTLYGWVFWLKKNNQQETKTITQLPLPVLFISLPFILCSIFILAYYLEHYLDSSVAYWDASITVLSICAQLMLCRKWIECWSLWFIVDAFIVVLHWQKGIPFHSAIHLLYLGLAYKGYVEWKKIQAQEERPLLYKDPVKVGIPNHS